MTLKVGRVNTVRSDYNLSRHLIPFLSQVPFFAELSRHITKHFSYDIPTAMVAYDMRDDTLAMYVNPAFAGGGTYLDPKSKEEVTCEGLTDFETQGLLTHEYNHVIFGHLNARIMAPDRYWAMAVDLANNSLITTSAVRPRDAAAGEVVRCLPRGGLIPGERPWVDPKEWAKMDAKRKASVEQLCDVIESMPTLKASEWYFNELMDKLGPPPEGDSGDDVLDTLDDHSAWKDVPDDMKEFLEGKIKSLVEKAVRFADSHADGWGNIPAELRAEIRRSVSSIVDWRAVLRQFVGSIQRGSRSTSIKRINRRYPYVHPGVKRGYCAKLIVPIDQSGSVGDEMLEMFFGELGCLTKKVSISVLHFDCECNEGDLYEWRKGMKLPPKRTRMGGTDFDAPTRFVNDPKNRGRWDGMLVMTDGGAGRPQPSRIKRGWVLGKGCSLPWETNELQIKLSDERQMKGAWR